MARQKVVAESLLQLADIRINGDRPWDMQVHDDDVFARALAQGSVGLGEAYMDGWWDSEQLDEFFNHVVRVRLDQKVGQQKGMFGYWLYAKLFNPQSRRRAAQVADVHYNLDNDLYERMLGPSMAYTCGYWKNATTLDEAQFNKYDLVCKKLGLKKGDRVLELGCGWGGFAAHAAKHYGCEMVSVSISSEQIKFAKKRYTDLPIQYVHCDYRDHQRYNPEAEQFDAAVSIGMCEHVGHKNYGTLFELVQSQLKDHGMFLLHTIGSNHFCTACDGWTNKYIFPNGVLPSVSGLSGAFMDYFVMEDWHNFGVDYDTTLMAWHDNFVANWDELKSRFDERFYRMWRYYLLSCAGMFRARGAQLWQIVLSKNGLSGGYQRPAE